MNEIVAVLRNVTGDRAARLVAQLNSKAIPKLPGLPIRVLGRKLCREVRRLGGATHRRRERCSEEIARQVVWNMSSGLIVGQSAQLLIDDPLRKSVGQDTAVSPSGARYGSAGSRVVLRAFAIA